MKFYEIDLLISEVFKKKREKEGKSKGERVRKDLRRGEGEDFGQGGGMLGGVAEELRRQRRSRNFDFHGSPAERIYAGEELRWQRRSRNFDFHGSPAERICAKNLDENASTRFLFMCASLLSLFLWAHAPEAAPRKPLRPPNNEKRTWVTTVP